MKGVVRILFIIFTTLLCGCAAMQAKLEKGELNVTSDMTQPIFVSPGLPKAVYVSVQNMTSLKVDPSAIQSRVIANLQGKGYNVVSNPSDASIILQAQLMDAVATFTPARKYGSGGGDAVGGVGGAMLGALGGTWKSTLLGAGAGLVAGSAVEAVTGSTVKIANYKLTFAIKAVEVPNNKEHVTQVNVYAERAQLHPEEAIQILIEKSSQIIAGILS